MHYNPYNYNINYNISQNINQNINGGKSYGTWDRPDSKFFHRSEDRNERIFSGHLQNLSPNPNKFYNSSPNDSGNFSVNEEIINLFVPPKRTVSNNILESTKRTPMKPKTSLFISADKDDKGEDFADLDELLDSITMELWDYAKTQKGSR